jgi:predicted DNA-binding protein (UPF0251 family)
LIIKRSLNYNNTIKTSRVEKVSDQFESRIEDRSGAGKVEDLSPDDVDASVVTGVELEYHRVELLRVVDLFRASQNRRRLASTRRSIEKLQRMKKT